MTTDPDDPGLPSPRRMLDGALRLAFGTAAPETATTTLRLRDLGGEHVPLAHVDPLAHVVGARYAVLGELGRGGIGVVLKAHDAGLGRNVALKVLDPRHRHNHDMLRRFVEEAQIAGQLQHPGIVPVHDLDHTSDRRPYFAMKLVAGRTLAELLRERRDPVDDQARLVAAFLQVCQTIAYAHARGVVHRDLKPGNVMIGGFGEVQVMDWGLAKLLDQAREESTEPRPAAVGDDATARAETVVGEVFGTPAYMAPEQAQGETARIDRRTDVFGLGALLCEILTGRPPYTGGDSAELRRRAAAGELDDARERLRSPSIEPELAAIARRCLEHEPAARYADGQAVADAVGAHLSSVRERARRAEVQAAETRVRARWTVVVAALVLAASLLAGAAWQWYRSERDARRATADRAVRGALQEAVAARSQAEAATGHDATAWRQAVVMAENAAAVAAAQSAGPEVTAEVQALLDQVHRRAARKERDASMLQRLLELRTPADEDVGTPGFIDRERERLQAQSAAAFRAYGVDVESMAPAVAAVALDGEIRLELIAALDYWCYMLDGMPRAVRDVPDPMSARLFELLETIDQDEWRRALRREYHRGQPWSPEVFEQLAATAGFDAQPPGCLLLLFHALTQVEHHTTALRFAQRAWAAHPQDFSLAFWLGIRLENADPPRHAEAAAHYRIASVLRPDMVEADHRLGVALRNAGDLDGARAVFEHLVARAPESGHWLAHLADVLDGSALRTRDRTLLAEARAKAERAVELEPGARSRSVLGVIQLRCGDREAAIATLRAAVAEQATPVALYTLGRAVQAAGEFEEAYGHYRRAYALEARLDFVADAAAVLGRMGRLQEEEVLVREALQRHPDHPDLHRHLGYALLARGESDQAIVEFERVLAQREPSIEVCSNLAWCYYSVGRLEEALAMVDRAIALGPTEPMAYLVRRDVLTALGRFDDAATTMATATRSFGDEPNVICEDAKARFLIGDSSGAATQLRRLQEHPGERLAPDLRGGAERLGRYLDRIGPIEALMAQPESTADAGDLLLAAEVAVARHRYRDAARLWQRAFTADPTQAAPGRDHHCYNAACSAVMALQDRAWTDDERQQWRLRALAWLEADLAHWQGLLAEPGGAADAARGILRSWRRDRDLARVRSEMALTHLPAEEAARWRALWIAVDAIAGDSR